MVEILQWLHHTIYFNPATDFPEQYNSECVIFIDFYKMSKAWEYFLMEILRGKQKWKEFRILSSKMISL